MYVRGKRFVASVLVFLYSVYLSFMEMITHRDSPARSV